jgi:hypothetical protein
LIGAMGGQRLRAATHLDVKDSDIEVVVDAVRDCAVSGFEQQQLVGAGPYSK